MKWLWNKIVDGIMLVLGFIIMSPMIIAAWYNNKSIKEKENGTDTNTPKT
jgi:flagellar biosynthesis protein FliP